MRFLFCCSSIKPSNDAEVLEFLEDVQEETSKNAEAQAVERKSSEEFSNVQNDGKGDQGVPQQTAEKWLCRDSNEDGGGLSRTVSKGVLCNLQSPAEPSLGQAASFVDVPDTPLARDGSTTPIRNPEILLCPDPDIITVDNTHSNEGADGYVAEQEQLSTRQDSDCSNNVFQGMPLGFEDTFFQDTHQSRTKANALGNATEGISRDVSRGHSTISAKSSSYNAPNPSHNREKILFRFTSVMKRLLWPAKRSESSSEKLVKLSFLDVSTLDDECEGRRRPRQGQGQGQNRRVRHSMPNLSQPQDVTPMQCFVKDEGPEPLEIVSAPERCLRTTHFHQEADDLLSTNKPLDLVKSEKCYPSGSKYGEGDAIRLPGVPTYAAPIPGKHLLQPQVLTVFSWSAPVHRRQLADGGVSFTFGDGSEQPNDPQTVQMSPHASQTPVFAGSNNPSRPTPMEIDATPPPSGSLLNQLVQQLREDIHRELEMQFQRQQQLIQQEVESRVRQLGFAPVSCNASEPNDQQTVAFCEWTLVLHYSTDRRVSERPMGVTEHEPLRNFELRRSSNEVPTASGTDSPCHEPKAGTPDTVLSKVTPRSSDEAPTTSGTDCSTCHEPKASTPNTVLPKVTLPGQSDPPDNGSSNDKPNNTGTHTPSSELGTPTIPCQDINNKSTTDGKSTGERQSKRKNVRIRPETLGDDYDVF